MLGRAGGEGQLARGQARQQRTITAAVLLLALLGVLVALLDWREVQRVAAEPRPVQRPARLLGGTCALHLLELGAGTAQSGEAVNFSAAP
jgi:hypothetical protein